MRVMYLLDSLTPGGTERSTVELLPQLVERGVNPSIAVFRRDEEDLGAAASRAGADLVTIGASSTAGRIRELRAHLTADGPDLVHTALYVADQVGRLAAWRTGIPVVSSFVNTPYEPARLNDPNVRRWRLRAAQTVDATTGRLLVARFHAVSDGVRDANCAALRLPRSRVTVAERGRDIAHLGVRSAERRASVRRELGIPNDAPVVLSLGRLDNQKGHLVLLDATAKLAQDLPGLSVLIAGKDGSAAADVRARLDRDPALAAHVRLLGHRADVGDLLCAADALVVSSHVEGTAGVTLEAMALGTPVVATRVAGIAGVLEDGSNSILVPIADPASLADGVRLVLTDSDLAARIAAQGADDFRRRFTVDAAADRLVSLYESVVRPRR